MAIRRKPSPISAFACVDSTSSTAQLIVRVPAGALAEAGRQPFRRESFHAFVRPFRRFLDQGKPEIGTVHYVLLAPNEASPPVVLGAWVLGDGRKSVEGQWIKPRRLVHFPGFGEGTFEYPPFSAERERIPYWHHLTFEETRAGNISSHPSARLDNRGTKIHRFPTAPLRFKNALGRHLGTAIIRQPQDLDLSGFVVLDFRPKGRLNTADIETKVRNSIASEHALIKLPYGTRWEPDRYLRVNYAIIKGTLADRNYPIRWKFDESLAAKVFQTHEPPPPYYEENLTRIGLIEGRSLLVAVSLFRGRPRWGSTWISPKAK